LDHPVYVEQKLILDCSAYEIVFMASTNTGNDKFYSPQMVVTIYNKIRNENDLTKKRKKGKKNKTNGIYLSKLVIKQNM